MSKRIFQTTILGHAVDSWVPPQTPADEQANAWRLSRMQRRLLSDTPWIRVVDAPTGSGKSYAFQKAVLPEGKNNGGHVLFVAPTRRLTENLASALVEGLMAETKPQAIDKNLDETAQRQAIEQAVMVWNGQQRIENALQGRTIWRKRQFSSIGNPFRLGRTVFTVLEIVRDMLFPTRLVAGEGDNRGSVWLSRFKHVVFDEFHTLGPDGLALALVMVAMVQAINQREQIRAKERNRDPRYTYLTFLSATPVDVLSFLKAGLGSTPHQATEVPTPARLVKLDDTDSGDGICLVSESLIHSDQPQWPTPGDWGTQARYRSLHGDVALEGVEAYTISELVEGRLEDIVQDIQQRRQVVCLWDSKAQLMVERQEVERIIRAAWASKGHGRELIFLEVHAAADRRRGEGTSPIALGAADVILGTASVEAGVTFRDNRLLLMEPGFTLMNMVQRLGRCARGINQGIPTQGRVVIRVDPDGSWKNDYRPWWPCVVEALQKMNSTSRVDTLMVALRQAAWPGADNGLYQQDGLGGRAQARASLFWAGCWMVLERNGKTRSNEWMGNPPRRVLGIKVQLSKLELLLKRPHKVRRNTGPINLQLLTTAEYGALKAWLARWRQESQALREIAPTIWVIDTNPKTHSWRAQPFDLAWLARFTKVLETGQACSIEQAKELFPNDEWSDGDIFIQLGVGRELKILPKEERKNKKKVPAGQDFLFPLGETRWVGETNSAAHGAAEQLEALANRVDERLQQWAALSGGSQEEGRKLVEALKRLSNLVSQTGRAVPATTQLDSAAAAWCESLVL